MSDDAPRTVGGALRAARQVGLDRVDAQWLLSAALDRPRSWLLAHPEAPLAAEQGARWQAWLARHAEGEPLAYLVGWTEFFGLRLQVDPAVLIPRPDTETLVRWGLDLLTRGPAPARVLDLGTGSGALALALKQHCPSARVSAVDASVSALGVARQNGQRLGLEIDWFESDWWSALGDRGPFDLVVSNPPYIEEGDPHLAALRHEPISALTAGIDGLDDLRRIVAGAATHLAEGGWLLVEHGSTQHEDVAGLLQAAGFEQVDTRPDLAGRPRCTGGRWRRGIRLGAAPGADAERKGVTCSRRGGPALDARPGVHRGESSMPMLSRSLVALLLAAGSWVAGAQTSEDLGLKVPGADDVWPRWQGRMQALASTPWWRHGPDDGRDAAGQRLESMSLLGDYYFLRNSPGLRARGGFRATSGLIIGTPTNRVLSGYGQGSGGLSQGMLPAYGAGASDATSGNGTVPYLGLGYSSASDRGGWGFSADVGLFARSPGSAVKLGRVFSGNQPLDDLLREMRLSPLLNVGVSYSF